MEEINDKIEKHRFNLSGHLWAINRSHKIYLEQYADSLDVTLGQYPYLVILNYKENFNQDEIAKLFQVDKCGVSRTLKKLEKKGLVKREQDPDNRRSNIITLTDKGSEIATFLKQKDDEWEEFVYENIDIPRDVFQDYVKKILNKSIKLTEDFKDENCCKLEK